MSTLEIKDLHVSVDTKDGEKPILRGVNLTVNSGEIHAVMGPNGSGKSTLASALAGHPKYKVTSGTVTLDGQDVLAMTVDERARAGIFLAMQYPVEVPGVSVANFLRTAKTAVAGAAPPLRTWGKEVNQAMANLRIDPGFAARSVNEGFSGGEKKRHEILQLELLKPKFAILDETDSGLDVDALRVVSEGVNRALANTDVGIILITHYTRILRYIHPDYVHVFVDGRIAEAGGPELADQLEEQGYDRFKPGSGSATAPIPDIAKAPVIADAAGVPDDGGSGRVAAAHGSGADGEIEPGFSAGGNASAAWSGSAGLNNDTASNNDNEYSNDADDSAPGEGETANFPLELAADAVPAKVQTKAGFEGTFDSNE